MIVVDANVIAYVLIQGPRTALARKARELDPHWCAPELWRHEYLNVLATYAVHGGATRQQVRALWDSGVALMEGCTEAADMGFALDLAVTHEISAYDAQYIALAKSLGVVCVTEDRRMQRGFPQVALSLERFCTGPWS